jgi:hypothetical protein
MSFAFNNGQVHNFNWNEFVFTPEEETKYSLVGWVTGKQFK